ncbi:hypothetical protein JW926_10035 [Candidatus Sumerlaeota bacterium]|nr:hypothetical protein [Candidatus Sumerlaeota bacterium]
MSRFRAHFIICLLFLSPFIFAENIWDLQAVHPDGTGSHPKVAASPVPSNKAIIEGIALNKSSEMLNPNLMWQIYVQAESPDRGGMAAWAGIFYNTAWPRYPDDIEAGDRIRIEGYIDNHNGKVNITERHSADPSLQFTVTILQEDVGMPAPIEISDLAECNYFDQTRSGGGEKYQSQWVLLKKAHIESGTWGAGNSLLLSDDDGSTLTMLLSDQGDFNLYSPPADTFDVRGVFDQEDDVLPYHQEYRLWVKKYSDIILPLNSRFWEHYE